MSTLQHQMQGRLTLAALGPDGLRRKLDEQRRNDGADERKVEARKRLAVDAQNHLSLLRAHVARYYDEPEIRNDILRHVDRSKNLLRMVANQVAIAYDRPPARSLRGADPEQERAFVAAYGEADAAVTFTQVNRFAFYLGVCHVLPRMEGDRLRLVVVTPDAADVLFDPDDDEPAILVYETRSHGAKYIAVDAERWQWIGKDWKVILDEKHGLGMVPWVTWRWQPQPRGDYWDRHAGQDLLDGTLEIGRIWAHARWVRKHNSKKLSTIHVGANVAVPENQNMSSNQPVVGHGDGEFKHEVHDTIVPIGEFLAEMREVVESVLEAYGLPSNVVDFNTASTQDAANAFPTAKVNSQAALAKVRDKSITSFESSEAELAVRVAALLRRSGRLELDTARVRESFRCRFAQMTWADHPKDRMATAKARMELGQTDPYQVYAEENPGVTYAEAVEYVDAHVEARAQFYDNWIASNVPADPSDDLKTAAQANGKVGGMTRAENQAGDQP